MQRLREAGIAVWVTVTEPTEAGLAISAGVDALTCQGVEAGAIAAHSGRRARGS